MMTKQKVIELVEKISSIVHPEHMYFEDVEQNNETVDDVIDLKDNVDYQIIIYKL
jgi:hypothetical protein